MNGFIAVFEGNTFAANCRPRAKTIWQHICKDNGNNVYHCNINDHSDDKNSAEL